VQKPYILHIHRYALLVSHWSSSGSTISLCTHILVRDDLHAHNVTGSLKDLLENIFGHARIQTPNIEGSLVRLGGSAADIATSACGGHHVARHGGTHRGGNGVVILGNDHRGPWRGRHVGGVGLAIALGSIILLILSGGSRLRSRWQGGGSGSGSVLGHRV
jgi:hypothetical protein